MSIQMCPVPDGSWGNLSIRAGPGEAVTPSLGFFHCVQSVSSSPQAFAYAICVVSHSCLCLLDRFYLYILFK